MTYSHNLARKLLILRSRQLIPDRLVGVGGLFEAALYRFARKWCEFGRSSVTVRRAEGVPGEAAEVDFGRLGLFQELGSGRPRVLWAFIMTMNYSRLSCVVPTFTQDLKAVIDCFERAFEFFGGCPRRIVIDNFKAAVE